MLTAEYRTVPQGWRCPACGMVYAPTVTACQNAHEPHSHIPALPGVIWHQTNPMPDFTTVPLSAASSLTASAAQNETGDE